MIKRRIPYVASASKRPRAVAGLLMTLGLAIGLQASMTLAAEPAAGDSTVVAAGDSTVAAAAAIAPALPPTDPRYIRARLESEYLLRISRDWYTPAADQGQTAECAAFLARFDSGYLRAIARGWLAACD